MSAPSTASPLSKLAAMPKIEMMLDNARTAKQTMFTDQSTNKVFLLDFP